MKKILLFAASAVVALASCTQSDDFFAGDEQLAQQQQQENAITFGTYMGNQQLTRAGKTGSLNTQGLKDADAGFGVFAYYTKTEDYTYSGEKTDGTNGQTTVKPNFMYNQKVEWNSSLDDSYITKWSYSPLKYWPNNISTTDVDDQDNDTNNDPATASENGGKISFFAYAPYVKTASGSDGITAMTANTEASDPIITYVVPSTGNPVDLLWGTYGETSINVNGGSTNAGVAYNTSSEYAKSILPGYKVNADLTKQKTNGKVDFAFKHALAKVGGSEENSSSVTNVHGLMVVLDVDDMKGAEKGGVYNNAETKVTVTSVNIVAKSFVDGDGDNVGDDGEYLTKLEGQLNLANGRWNIIGTKGNSSAAATETHLINSNGSGAQGTLNSNIAEPTSLAKTEAGWNGLPNGVLTTPQNVYASEAAPLVFIPGTHPELTITVVYTVRTKDANLADAYSEVVQTITKKVTFTKAVELNKQYSLLMHLGLTGVKFTASVSDWQVAGDDNNNGVIDGSENLDIQDVFVPINVAAYSVVLSAPATLENNVVASSAPDVTISPSGIRYYDYATGTGVFTTHADATVGDYTFTKDGDFITLATNVASFSDNTTTRKRVGTVTVAYNGANVNGVSKDVMEPAVLTFTQAAGALQITDPTGLTATELSTAAKVVDLVVKDAGGNTINLTDASNAATITVPAGWSYVKTATGLKVTVPKGTTGTNNVTVKVNDTEVKTVTFTVS